MPSGARESQLLGGVYNRDIFKDPKKRHDHVSVLYDKDLCVICCSYSVPGVPGVTMVLPESHQG